MTEQLSMVRSGLRSGWWIVVLAAVAGGLVAGAAVLSSAPQYQAMAKLDIDLTTVNQQSRLPKPDDMVAVAQSAEFLEALRASHPGEFEVKAYTSTGPQEYVWVEVTSADEQLASAVADDALTRLIEEYRLIVTPLIEADKAALDANKKALESFGSDSTDDSTDSYYRWNVLKSDLAERENLLFLESAYSYTGEVESGPSSRTTEMGAAVAGGALVGAFLGFVLAFFRERGTARRSGEG